MDSQFPIVLKSRHFVILNTSINSVQARFRISLILILKFPPVKKLITYYLDYSKISNILNIIDKNGVIFRI